MIIKVNLDERIAITDTGRSLPVVGMLDRFGEETEINNDAVTITCGRGHEWYQVILSGQTVTVH